MEQRLLRGPGLRRVRLCAAAPEPRHVPGGLWPLQLLREPAAGQLGGSSSSTKELGELVPSKRLSRL